MRVGQVRHWAQQLCRIAQPTLGSDSELVQRVVSSRDPAAFEELVLRHGPLVWGVCRRMLKTRADAEDAFQATFLVLARQAASIRNPGSLGPWLYGVAVRVARRVPRQTESLVADPARPDPDPVESLSVQEFLTVLDDELATLSDKYRHPLVLCYLQELTQDEAARRLGVSLSTLKRRLDAGREYLRVRLQRRGVELPALLVAVGIASGPVPVTLAQGATMMATAPASVGLVSAPVLTLSEGVLHAMWETKLRSWIMGFLLATAAASGTGYFALTGPAQTGTGAGGRPEVIPPAGTSPASNPVPIRSDQAAQFLIEQARSEVIVQEANVQLAQVELERLKQLAGSGASSQFEVEKGEIKVRQAKALMEQARSKLAQVLAQEQARRQADQDRIRVWEASKEKLTSSYERGPATPPTAQDRALLEQACKLAQEILEACIKRFQTGSASPDEVYLWSNRLMEAEQILDPNNPIPSVMAHVERMKKLEASMSDPHPQIVRKMSQYYRLEAERALNEARRRPKGASDPQTIELRETQDRIMQLERLLKESQDRLRLALDQSQAQQQALDSFLHQKLREAPLTGSKPAPIKEPAFGTWKGKVIVVDGDFLTFTPGADAGVKQGDLVNIYRGGAKPEKYLGQVMIHIVTPKETIGRFVPEKPKPPADAMPKLDDEIRPKQW